MDLPRYVLCQVRCPKCKKDRMDLIDIMAPKGGLPPAAGKERFSVLCWFCMEEVPGGPTPFQKEYNAKVKAREEEIKKTAPTMTKIQILALRSPDRSGKKSKDGEGP